MLSKSECGAAFRAQQGSMTVEWHGERSRAALHTAVGIIVHHHHHHHKGHNDDHNHDAMKTTMKTQS